ncbi:MarR family transcriptional regulator [Rhizobium sp. FKL33]|uniref:MarR family winged helix-turn-helix transcriptional regulator n=1 Tax=Rhizobium sp. FKL33 TaxID=2562307 RepID=UPI0010C157C3|nr:MarR family transcriptional regulator [Rhizobium sp. FKL33]
MSIQRAVPFQTTIFVKDHCICLHAQRAARALARRFDKAMKPFGLTNGQFSLLMSLNRPEPPPLSAVADLLAMDRTTLTAALKPLERDGLLKVIPSEKDRRARLLLLTDAGLDVLARALPVWKSEHEALDKEMPQGDMDRLRQDLRRIG